jgi:hypothetical protein
MTRSAAVSIALCLCASSTRAQSDAYWEIRPIAGVTIPTGAHRRAFGDAAFVGAGTSVRLTSSLDLVANFAFQAPRASYAVADHHAHVLVYNAGIEKLRRPVDLKGRGRWVPFVGAGIGGRANDFRSADLTSTACYAAYGSGGVAYERPRAAFRFEVRDNVFCYKSPVAPYEQTTRNDIAVGVGFGLRF